MSKQNTDAKALKLAKALKNGHNWKQLAKWHNDGYFALTTDDIGDVPVRLFLTASLLQDLEDIIYRQIVNATRFPGVRMVVITPDTHFGYGVPVGCVLITDYNEGAIAMGPVGYDIGCGMMSAKSDVSVDEATPEKRLEFNRLVMQGVSMGAGGASHKLGQVSKTEFEKLIRGGADYYVKSYGASFDRTQAERHCIPVDDDWQVPYGGAGRPERGMNQIGSLGAGNHFIELQHAKETGTLFVQVHTGSRGFGHGLATNYFEIAKNERPESTTDIDLGYFTPDSKHYKSYLNAVAAGGNFAILNRLVIFEQVAEAFKKVFKQDLHLFYEISHNLVQKEWHPDFDDVWVHRKGATRAFPAGYPALKGTQWEKTGHPVLIPGSNKDWSYILRPLAGAVKSGFSVNHGAGRRLSRGEASRQLSQEAMDEAYRKAGVVVNTDGHVPLDEAAPAYKSSTEVVKAVINAGLAEIEYTLWPLASLKGTEERRPKRDNKPKKTSQHH
ncbi:MAG: RtcB family protein [Candidatus Melainabacteria bacterium]|nr:RtcB family protein [Candidatus Melainabacteria bacterium]